MRLWASWIALAFLSGCSADEDAQTRIYERMLAPCCYTQTLGTHDSPTALQLRREVHARLAAGESEHSIERDLIWRYGGRIRAVPAGFALNRYGGWMLVTALLGALLPVVFRLRAMRRRGGSAAPTTQDVTDGTTSERLQDELDRLD